MPRGKMCSMARPRDSYRASLAKQYQLSKHVRDHLQPALLDQLEMCRDEPARRLLLGKGREDEGMTIRYGRWTYNHQDYNLVFGRGLYTVNLTLIRSSAAMLEAIFEIHSQSWATAMVVEDFLDALEEIFTPLDTLCPNGEDKRLPQDFLLAREDSDVSTAW